MKKLTITPVAFSTIVVIVSLFTSGCIADADTAGCDALTHGSHAALSDEGVDPCGNEDYDDDSDDGDTDPVDANESVNGPKLAPAALCTTPACNRP